MLKLQMRQLKSSWIPTSTKPGVMTRITTLANTVTIIDLVSVSPNKSNTRSGLESGLSPLMFAPSGSEASMTTTLPSFTLASSLIVHTLTSLKDHNTQSILTELLLNSDHMDPTLIEIQHVLPTVNARLTQMSLTVKMIWWSSDNAQPTSWMTLLMLNSSGHSEMNLNQDGHTLRPMIKAGLDKPEFLKKPLNETVNVSKKIIKCLMWT